LGEIDFLRAIAEVRFLRETLRYAVLQIRRANATIW
jgi:hypothetical protein